jgi:hypothetical protein
MRASDIQREIDRMTTRIVTDSNGRKHITTEPLLHPSQRPWVGLTDEEVSDFIKASWGRGVTPEHFIQAIEAKLKDKNV